MMDIKGPKIFRDTKAQDIEYEPSEWRLGEINGEKNGIVHLPSWTVFKIGDEGASVVHLADQKYRPDAEELPKLAVVTLEVFRSGKASWKPRGVCSHPHP